MMTLADSPRRPPTPSQAALAASSGLDLEAERRRLKVRLLRDLVANGLYRVSVDALAERLATVLE
jgi:hypothetical protein